MGCQCTDRGGLWEIRQSLICAAEDDSGSRQSESRVDGAEQEEAESKLTTKVPLKRNLARVIESQMLEWGTVLRNQAWLPLLPGTSFKSHNRHTSGCRGIILCVLA